MKPSNCPIAILLMIAVAACQQDPKAPAAPTGPRQSGTALAAAAAVHPAITISVTDLTTGQTIGNAQTVTAGDLFQVTVTTSAVDCAGQFVVTALGAPGSAPSVLVQFVPFIIGPAVSTNSVTGGILTANPLGSSRNDWKVSASCNGASTAQFAFDRFEFFAGP